MRRGQIIIAACAPHPQHFLVKSKRPLPAFFRLMDFLRPQQQRLRCLSPGKHDGHGASSHLGEGAWVLVAEPGIHVGILSTAVHGATKLFKVMTILGMHPSMTTLAPLRTVMRGCCSRASNCWGSPAAPFRITGHHMLNFMTSGKMSLSLASLSRLR